MGTNNSKSQLARAAAILTTGEVSGATLAIHSMVKGQEVCLQVDFTLGSLTNVTLKPYVSMDGATWYPHVFEDGITKTRVLTASETQNYKLAPAPGWNFLRVSATGSGTLTSSSLTMTYRFRQQGT